MIIPFKYNINMIGDNFIIGDWPNPQSPIPIPNPHLNDVFNVLYFILIKFTINYNLITIIHSK